MPVVRQGRVSIYYEEVGAGYPVLLFAPGGLLSRTETWSNKGPAPFDPREELVSEFRLIAMDQRNAGRSRAPIRPTDGWASFTDDHVLLMDRLGVARAHVMGSCIGCSFCLSLMERAPERVSAAVLLQPIGRSADNVPQSRQQLERWVASLPASRRPPQGTVEALFQNLYGGDFVFSVSREFVRGCPTPLLVLPGGDAIHPRSVSLEVAELCPRASILEPWKPATAEVIEAVRRFLRSHSPNAGLPFLNR